MWHSKCHTTFVVAAIASEDPGARISGTALDVTEQDLASADVYEAEEEYRRHFLRLSSGREAWVYMHDRAP